MKLFTDVMSLKQNVVELLSSKEKLNKKIVLLTQEREEQSARLSSIEEVLRKTVENKDKIVEEINEVDKS